MSKILIVDDDREIVDLLSIYCKNEGYDPIKAYDGVDAFRKLEENADVQLIILDVMMPKKDGISVVKELREQNNPIPILMLSAKSADMDKIQGLTTGADDYVSKPFDTGEVVARVKAVLRRTAAPPEYGKGDVVSFTGLEINMAERSVTAFDKPVALANKEMEVLWQLVSRPGMVMSREQLLETVWDYSYCGDTRTVDTHVKRLRKKLGSGPDTPWDIKTIWGIGYKFEVRK